MNPKTSTPVPPLGSDAVWAAGWTPAEARLAVDQFRRGSSFRWGWQLSLDAPGYPPIKSALDQRLATPCGLPWGVSGGARAPGRIEAEAARLIFQQHLARLIRTTLRDLAMCGLSVWHHPLAVDPETLRTEIAPYTPPSASPDPDGGLAWTQPTGGVQRWPLSAVGWTAYPLLGVVGYYAIAQGGQWIQLPRPGTTEGEWTVVGEGDMPHLDAAICALDMEFTAGMLSRRARSNLAVSAGKASPIGIMPPGVPVHTPPDEQGRLVQGPGEDAAATLAAVGTEQTAALFPFGFKVDKFELTTTGAAEYFHTDLLDSLLMVSLAVMGHGGALGKTDAQYRSEKGREVDVPESLTRRDVRAIERAANGLFAMLAEMNSGLSADRAPKLDGHLPDADQAARRKAEGEAMLQVAAVLQAEGEAGCAVTQERADEIARRLGAPPPIIAAQSPARVLAWHVEQKLVAPDQALATLGLPPLPNGAGSVERLARERLSGKDESGKAASLGDATVEATPPDVPPGASPVAPPPAIPGAP